MKHPITILHIMQGTHAHGGTPRELLSIIVNGDRTKVRHVVLLFANSVENLNEEYRKADVIVEEVNRPQNWDLRLLWDIIKVAKQHRCDIINTHFARADIYGTVAGFLAGVPVVKSVHGIAWNDARWLQKIDGLLSRLRVCTICNSEATRSAVISQSGARNTKVVYIGVPDHSVRLTEQQRFVKRSELSLPQDAFVIIHVGGMIALREQSVIINAVKYCVDEGIDAYLLFVGDGPLRRRLETESREAGLAPRIRFLGYRNDVFELNAVSDIYVNMAREEGFGIAVMEAMQTELPVVLANAGALPELIEDKVSGLLVPPGDARGLARALNRLASDINLAKRFGVEAKRRAKNLFSIKRYVNEIDDIYLAIADDRDVN